MLYNTNFADELSDIAIEATGRPPIAIPPVAALQPHEMDAHPLSYLLWATVTHYTHTIAAELRFYGENLDGEVSAAIETAADDARADGELIGFDLAADALSAASPTITVAPDHEVSVDLGLSDTGLRTDAIEALEGRLADVIDEALEAARDAAYAEGLAAGRAE